MRALLSISVLGLLIGCGPAQHIYAPTFVSADKPTVDLTSFSALSKNVFDTKCVGCHKGADAAGGVDLSSYEKILASGDAVVPGQPEKSEIYKQVKSGDMPMGESPLGKAEVQAIEEWIAAGAPNGTFPSALETPVGDPVPPANTPDPATPAPPPPAPTYTDVQTNLFSAYCVKCHSGPKPAKGLDLTTYASLMAKSGLVVPGQSQNSGVYLIIKAGKMPPKGVVIPVDILDSLKAWIDAGAQNN